MNKTFKKLTDESIMAFGKHKGQSLENVPASYLLWIEKELKYQKILDSFRNGLLVYIDECRDHLEFEARKRG